MGTIKVIGNATRKVHPDVMKVDIVFEAQEKKSSYATRIVVEQCDRFLTRITDAGMDKDLITLDDSVNSTSRPRYRNESDVFEAERGIRIYLPYDAKILNDIVYILNEEDLNFRYNVRCEISNEEQIERELLAEAVKDSKARAEEIASSLSMELAGVKKIYSNDEYGDDFLFEESARKISVLGERERSVSDDLNSIERKLEQSVVVIWNVK